MHDDVPVARVFRMLCSTEKGRNPGFLRVLVRTVSCNLSVCKFSYELCSFNRESTDIDLIKCEQFVCEQC